MASPLDGVKVLDLSRVLAGPYCTMILGDLGADVIKVEHPDGDETRGWGPPFLGGESIYYLSVNRNKRSITADFRQDLSLIEHLASQADILVENFLPGSLERAGISLAALRERNPRLITLTISSGPDASAPGYDFIVQAASGLMSITGPVDGPPSKVGVAIVDLTTGMMAANAILAALYAREKSGRGQHIDISLMETAVSWLANVGTSVLNTDKDAKRYGNGHPTIVPYQTFETMDGTVAVGVGNDQQFARMCDALGFSSGLTTNRERVENRSELIAALQQHLANWKSEDLVARLRDARVPASKVRSVREAVMEMEAVHLEHPKVGELKLLNFPFRFSDTPARVLRHPPMLGEHNGDELWGLKRLSSKK